MLKDSKHTEEAKKKMSESKKGKKRKSFTEDHRKNISKTHSGNKNGSWKGGISKVENYKKEYLKKWIIKNKEIYSFYSKHRRLRKLKANGSHNFGDWETLKAQYNFTCLCCGKKEPEIKLTEDHIIPLSKGGSDNIENIQPLCGRCNSQKYIKIINYKII